MIYIKHILFISYSNSTTKISKQESKQLLLMHKTCIYWYFKKAILHNTVYQKLSKKVKALPNKSVAQWGLECTNI